MAKSLHVILRREERSALLRMSKDDVRMPNDQLRHLIVSEAIRRGLMQASNVNRATEILADQTSPQHDVAG